MKQYTPDQKLIRSELAKCIISQRQIAKQLRNYCIYSVSKRKLSGIIINTEYLNSLLKDMDRLRHRNEYLLTLLFSINTGRH